MARPARYPMFLVAVIVAVIAAVAVGVAAFADRRTPSSAGDSSTTSVQAASTPAGTSPSTASPTAPVAAGTPTTGPPTTPVPTSAPPTAPPTTGSVLPPADNGVLPQTVALPSADTAAFRAEMQLLWDGITRGDPAEAQRAFFPESAYVQVKALSDDAADYADRLVFHFRLDVEAAHDLLGADGRGARLLQVLVPSGEAAWIPPGACYNTLGYWHQPGARLVYEEGGEERSFGIASLISWRGYWYVVHLGAVLPPAATGVVDDPAVGPGAEGPPGGC